MTSSVILLSIGVILLILIWAAGFRRGRSSPAASGEVPDSSEYVVRLPPRGLLARCLSEEDFRFAVSLGSKNISRLLLRERRRLALDWLRITRREATRMFDLHRRAVRHSPDLRPLVEIRLLGQLSCLFLIYEILAGLVWLYGPLRAHIYIRSIQGLAGALSDLGSRIAVSAAAVTTSSVTHKEYGV